MILDINLDDIIKGVFLVILAICGNFTAQLLGCQTQKLLETNMFSKYFIAYLILFFTIDFVSDKKKDIFNTGREALYIWILFIMFSRMNLFFTIIVFILLIITYLINMQINYLKENKPNDKNIKYLNNIHKQIYIVICFTILLGFTMYFIKQRKDHKKNWSTTKFIFGRTNCDGLK
tara:strand:- start:187 stop:714 length:528 start_codon:yes stop_codon:yes gene_type:complete